jgi:hypothetical protein
MMFGPAQGRDASIRSRLGHEGDEFVELPLSQPFCKPLEISRWHQAPGGSACERIKQAGHASGACAARIRYQKLLAQLIPAVEHE